MNIGIVILATNAYFVLGIRFIKKFMHHYKGDNNITFYFFSDTDPMPYVQNGVDIKYFHVTNKNWVDGTNLKYESIMKTVEVLKSDYLFYFDADTNIGTNFTEEWFLGDLVGGQHYQDRFAHKENKDKPFDRNPNSKAYVPLDTQLPEMYFYGAFFGGTSASMISFCELMYFYQQEDKKIGYEPVWNDESYLNREFHFNPPTKIVYSTEFKFLVSDKGGMAETRNVDLNISEHKKKLLEYKDKVIDIRNNEVVLI
jgi:hypothetical protein